MKLREKIEQAGLESKIVRAVIRRIGGGQNLDNGCPLKGASDKIIDYCLKQWNKQEVAA